MREGLEYDEKSAMVLYIFAVKCHNEKNKEKNFRIRRGRKNE